MPNVYPCPVPADAFLVNYAQGGAYVDCYVAEITRAVSQAEYVETFYTGALFKVERRLLAWFASRPSTDADAKALAAGNADTFAAWRVEQRSADQLLLCDFTGRTRSWLMVAPVDGQTAGTRLYLGSAVVPVLNKASGRAELGIPFKALLGFHKLYSRALLSAAHSRLAKSGRVVPDAISDGK